MERAAGKKIMIAFVMFVLVTMSLTEDPTVSIPSAAGTQPKPESKSQQAVQPKIGEPAHVQTTKQKPADQTTKPIQPTKPSQTVNHEQPAKPSVHTEQSQQSTKTHAQTQSLPEPIVSQQPQHQPEQQTEQNLNILAQQPTTLSQQQLLAQDGGESVDFIIDPLKQNVLQNEEKKFEHSSWSKLNKKMKPWIVEEFQHIKDADSILTHEIFSFQLDKVSDFKWNPTQFKSGPLKFVVEVFMMSRGDVVYPQNPQQDDYVEVLTQSQSSSSFTSLGKVYTKRIFTINFFSDFQIIRLRNNWPKQVLIQVSLEATKFIPEKALDDDSLQIPAQKIKTILEQLQETEMKREKIFRSEWGFHDRQEHHQSEMLILTGVELVIILGTAIVQIYCIKNLFDNRLVV